MDECDSILMGKSFGLVDDTGADFITVVSVGVNNKSAVGSINENNKYNDTTTNSSDYITVLTIGEDKFYKDEDFHHPEQHQIEEVLVYRLPGERLGFGLKFDGGIKASETVKRLFIQSCAVDSPASRVKSSWGVLVEGDEVLEIDRVPVNNMTRIDCVRCLKDSNVVITLLIRHLGCHIPDLIALHRYHDEVNVDNINEIECKRVPPPPPPVPPRKVPRNGSKKTEVVARSDSLKKVRRSPECAKREATASRILADGGLEPPNAQIYIDLFSQESFYSLSESDDTSSSISTVVDRLSSFPTTGASSLAGSLPSTPTAIQNKRLHLNNVLSSLETDMQFMNDKDYYLFDRLTSLSQADVENAAAVDDLPPVIPPRNITEKEVASSAASTLQLQPPTNFQDAPLSYGNEDVSVIESTIKIAAQEFVDNQEPNQKPSPRVRHNTPAAKLRQHLHPNLFNGESIEVDGKTRNGVENSSNLEDAVDVVDEQNQQKVAAVKASRKIRPPPRAKQQQTQREHNNNDCGIKTVDLIIPDALDEKSTNVNNNNVTYANNNLPRLVDFVPKHSKQKDEDIEGRTFPNGKDGQECTKREDNGSFGIGTWNGVEFGTWKASSATQQLATIGEVEETPPQLANYKACIKENGASEKVPSTSNNKKMHLDFAMASPPTYSRQPPDGHEFPDYEERQHSSNDHDTMDSLDSIDVAQEEQAIVTEGVQAVDRSESPTPIRSTCTTFIENELRSESIRPDPAQMNGPRSSLDANLFQLKSSIVSSLTISDIFTSPRMLHSRSQSLVDISKPDRWSQIAEQRQRGLSKLKGLVIPEHVPSEPSLVHDLPEITSSTKMPKLPDFQPTPIQINAIQVTKTVSSHRSSINLPSPIWNQQDANISSLPKYSPAFKRRSLQVYSKEQLSKRSSPATVTPSAERFSTGFVYPETKSQQLPLATSNEDPGSAERNSSLLSLNDSDNDSAFKSCESLHSLEYNNTSQKEVETVNKRNSQPSPYSAAAIFQTKCTIFEQQNGQETRSQIRSPRVNSSDNYNFGQIKQNLLKTNGDVHKTEASGKLDSNIYSNTVSPKRTVPKSMQSNPVASVNDLRKKFQTPDAVHFTKANNTKMMLPDLPQSTKPLAIPSRFSHKFEENAPPLPIVQKPDQQQMSAQDTLSAITKALTEFGEGIRNEDCFVATLKPEIPGGSLGVTLAGGTDYESKGITVYSIRAGSVASKVVKLKRGDQILSINGKLMKDLTHAASTALLKGPKTEFEIVFCSRNEPISPIAITPKRNSRSFDMPPTNFVDPSDVPAVTLANTTNSVTGEGKHTSSLPSIEVSIEKTSAGLGFSIAGGVDSPNGDLPLVVKKVFSGGAAEKSGMLRAHDELLTIGAVNVTAMSRLDVWTMMKKLPEGPVCLTLRR